MTFIKFLLFTLILLLGFPQQTSAAQFTKTEKENFFSKKEQAPDEEDDVGDIAPLAPASGGSTPSLASRCYGHVITPDNQQKWDAILCASEATPENIKVIQQALTDRKAYKGKIDGKLSTATISAIQSFQVKSGLPVGEITMETLQALNIKSDL